MVDSTRMKGLRLAGLALCGGIAVVALTAAQRPSALGQAAPGLWEIDGLPGAKSPLKQCVGDVSTFVQFEHRTRNCGRRIISDGPSSTVVEYSCGAAGFGHSKLDVITPRSLRIDTQGVSGGLPFSYVLQARRVGDCPTTSTASRH
jgi:hypothetical protein